MKDSCNFASCGEERSMKGLMGNPSYSLDDEEAKSLELHMVQVGQEVELWPGQVEAPGGRSVVVLQHRPVIVEHRLQHTGGTSQVTCSIHQEPLRQNVSPLQSDGLTRSPLIKLTSDCRVWSVLELFFFFFFSSCLWFPATSGPPSSDTSTSTLSSLIRGSPVKSNASPAASTEHGKPFRLTLGFVRKSAVSGNSTGDRVTRDDEEPEPAARRPWLGELSGLRLGDVPGEFEGRTGQERGRKEAESREEKAEDEEEVELRRG
ncbi:hypothetical protein EYF80_003106 [Liparis tanakae]|uniref:Uncharacterized protein n=1 Tax=Liparis tanakae TaxID=230148 RepID=A0A4Z2JAD8_9TELE|nr:hypothetical protein EYF80_003106 [Liparis tanakae]